MAGSEYHVPVMLPEVIEGLNIKPNGTYVDCTFGGGGHSTAILERLDKNGKLYVFDQDEAAQGNLPDDERAIFIPQNFRHIQRFLRLYKVTEVNGVLADLGVSSHQFDEAGRGFSTRFDAKLDMRMDQRQVINAAHILQNFSETQLHKLFEQYGEVTNSKTLAKQIVEARKSQHLTTINEFKRAVEPVVKGNPAKYFAQVFQALRIEVNDEIGSLKELLQQLPSLLIVGGRAVVISFHSLEDRIVKNFFKNASFEDKEVDNVYGRKEESPFRIITKKPLTASGAELKQNPRSRSAKLRVAERKKI